MDHTVERQELLEHSNEDAAALFHAFAPPPFYKPKPLEKLLCLPRLTWDDNAPFMRAYSDDLRMSGIEMEDWMHFVDGLNMAVIASPPLRVVNMVGMVVGMVPNHWAMLAGTAIQIGAGASIAVLSKTLTDRYLRRANKEYFAPRGFRVRLCKTAAMRQLIGLDPTPDPDAPPPGFGDKAKAAAAQTGRVAETIVLHLPIARRLYNSLAPKVQSIQPGSIADAEQNAEISGATARRLGIIAGYTLPLRFDVPEPQPLEGSYQKASDLAVRLDSWKATTADNDKERKRQLLAVVEGRAEWDTISPPKASTPEADAEKGFFKKMVDDRAQRRDERSYKKTMRRLEKGKGKRRIKAQVEIADRLEYKSTRNLVWLVLLNEEQDALINDTDVVDNDEDEERVPAEVWRNEIRLEEAEYARYLQRADDQFYEEERLSQEVAYKHL